MAEIRKVKNLALNCLKPNLVKFLRSPIILGGCGRSGTSLLLSMLSCHPQIFPIPIETNVFVKKEIGISFIYKYLLSRRIPMKCDRWCEKTPRNVCHFGQILEQFGASVKLIHIVRDGRDVVLSKHPSDSSRTWVSPERWIHDVGLGLQYKNHPRVLTVRYEDLIENRGNSLRDICKFLELEFHSNFEDFPLFAKVKTHSAVGGKFTPLVNSSIGKWQQEKDDLNVTKLTRDPVGRSLLEEFGYL